MNLKTPDVQANSWLCVYRLKTIQDALVNTAHLPGVTAEVGVFKGGTSLFILQNSNKHHYVLDTFNGMPQTQSIDWHKQGDFSDTSLVHVDQLLSDNNFTNYSIYKGIFPKQNAEYLSHKIFSVVHIDVDIYESTKECIEFFYPRMTPGGVIVLDDYTTPSCPGVKPAIDEYMADKPEKPELSAMHGQAIIRMRG